MSSSILFNCKPGPLLCSCSCSSTSSFIFKFKFKFKFPARSQCSPLPTVEFHATTPRASTHNHISISIENESGSGAGASTSTSRRRALAFVAATTTPLLLLFNHEASAVKAAGLVSYCQHFFLPSIHAWILFHFYFFFFLCFFRCNWWFWTDIRYYLLGLGKVSLGHNGCHNSLKWKWLNISVNCGKSCPKRTKKKKPHQQ